MNTSKWFCLFFLVYIFLYVMNRLGYIFPDPIQFYLADLLAVPVIATLSMWFTRWTVQQQDFILPRWQIVFIILLLAVLFEILLPLKMNRYTADPIDVLMYTLGGMFYWKVMNTSAPKNCVTFVWLKQRLTVKLSHLYKILGENVDKWISSCSFF